MPSPSPMASLALAFTLSTLLSIVCCSPIITSDALFANVLSKIPSITFVTSTPSMSNDTDIYFSSFAWPSNRTAQQADYVSVPVATMALCLAALPNGAVNLSTAPTMADISYLLTGQSTGAAWLRSDWTSSTRVSRVYWADSSTTPLLNAFKTWRGAPFTSTTTLPSSVTANPTVTRLPTDTDVASALANDPSAVAFMPLTAAVLAKFACLSITTPTSSGGTAVVAPQLQASTASVITVSSSSLAATCPVGAGCYPLLGTLVAHVRKRSSSAAPCSTASSLLPFIYTFVSSSGPIAAPLSRWSMLFPPTATQIATLQSLTTSTCMYETVVVKGAGGVTLQAALYDWFYQYFISTNGTIFVNYNGTSASAGLTAMENKAVDLASGSALGVTDRMAFPTLHTLPALGTSVSLVVNLGQPVPVSLPRCSITSIFNGTIQWWNDTSIQSVNPMTVMPQQRIDVTLRVEPATTTDILMAGLRSLDMECFGTTVIAPTAALPNITKASRFTGNSAVANHVVATPFSIAWVSSDYANNNNLNQASIQADDGSVTTASKTDVQTSIAAGVYDPMSSDYVLVDQLEGYPFVGVSYFLVQLNVQGGDCRRYKAAADFILWTLSSPTAVALAIADQFLPLGNDVRDACVQFLMSAAMCNGSAVYPVPAEAVLWWPEALAGGLILLMFVTVSARAGYRSWVSGARPVDPTKPIAIMFVGVKNPATVMEAGEKNVAEVYRRIAETTRRMVRKHRCYEARRVDAWTTMIVAKSAQAAVACAEDLVLALSVDVQWVDEVLTHPLPGQAHSRNHLQTSKLSALSARSSGKSNKSGASGRMEAGAKKQQHEMRTLTHPSMGTRTSSSHTRFTVQQCTPQIYAGVHWAHVMIDDSQEDVVSYYGAGIATAAGVADHAVDGQVVVSREVVDELNMQQPENAQTDYLFATVKTSDDITVMSLTTPRFPEWLLARTAARRKSMEENGSDGVGNMIAAAMASADGALAKRRIAVASLLVRDLVGDGAEGRAAVIRETLEDLRDIVTGHRGEIHSITDGVVTVTIGAAAPVAMAAVRAAQIAMDASELCIAAGINSGVALVGNAMGGKAATVGRIVSGAALMRLVAARAKVPVVASDSLQSDLSARFQLATVDVVSAPWDLKKHVRCYGVAEERIASEEGEWLYEMNDGFAPIERRVDDCLLGKAAPLPPPNEGSSATRSNAFLDRHPEYCELSNDLYAGLQQAVASNCVSEFTARRLGAIGNFSVFGGSFAP